MLKAVIIFTIMFLHNTLNTKNVKTTEEDLNFLLQILNAQNFEEAINEFELNDFLKQDFSEQTDQYKTTLAEVQAFKLIHLQSQTPYLALERQRWFTYKNSILTKMNFQKQNLNLGVKIFNKVLKLYEQFYKDCQIFFDNLDQQTMRNMHYYLNAQYHSIFQYIILDDIFPATQSEQYHHFPNYQEMLDNNKKLDLKLTNFLNQIKKSKFHVIYVNLVKHLQIVYDDLKSMDGGVADMLKFYDLYEIFLSMQLKSQWGSRKQIILRNLTDLNTKWRTNFLIPFLDSLPTILYASKNIEILFQFPNSKQLESKDLQVAALYLITLYTNFELLQRKILYFKGTQSYLKQYYKQTVEVLRDLDMGIINNTNEEKILQNLAKSFQLIFQKKFKHIIILMYINEFNISQQIKKQNI